jgi:hypothetical protein
MGTKLFRIIIVLIWAAVHGCKEDPVDPTIQPPPPGLPLAKAGADQLIYLPNQPTAILDGSASSHPTYALSELNFKWRQITGSKLLEVPVEQRRIEVTFKEAGIYDFELSVSDKTGKIGRDTVSVSVQLGNSCNQDIENLYATFAQPMIVDNDAPFEMSMAANEKYIVLGGGWRWVSNEWGEGAFIAGDVIIYDISAQSKTERKLSEDRVEIGIALTEDKAYFAGGTGFGASNVVDVYDFSTKLMSKEALSVGRYAVCAVTAGTKVFFAGGFDGSDQASDVVDILDRTTNTWSTAKLSAPRGRISGTVLGDKVYFAGGDIGWMSVSRVDIYDLNSGQWTTAELPASRSLISSSVLGDKILFAGGVDPKNNRLIQQVDFFTPATASFQSVCLTVSGSSVPNNSVASAVLNGKDWFYAGGSAISRFRNDVGKWGIAQIPEGWNILGLVSSGNDLYCLKYEPLDYSGSLSLLRVTF